MPEPLAVEMRGIVKRFPGVLANDQVDFELRPGEIHGLLGENGAGKSTLMSVLAGMYRPEAGSILVRGLPVSFSSPRHAIAAGLGMIHQHFTLVQSQTVTENILLGLDRPRFWLRLRDYDKTMSALGEQYGLSVSPHAKIWQLSVGEQQRVEILKMLYRGVQVLIMDEPTAVLAPQEIDGLFGTLRAMCAEGKSIVFISHKLNEVMKIADRVTVLRKGRVTAAGLLIGGTSQKELAQLMVGREVLFHLDKQPCTPGEVVLSVEGVSADNDKGLPALHAVSLTLRAGEVVGIAGVAGNGQAELAEVITGLRRATAGRVVVSGEPMVNQGARRAIEKHVAHIPEDRNHVGTAPNLSITDNIIMKSYHHKPVAHGWSLNQLAAKNQAEHLKDEYNILAPNVGTRVRLLSGGNLQRVILARELSANPLLLIAVQPTRGLDVGAIEGVQRLLLAQRTAGAAILLISEELEEILALSDRVVVMYDGRIAGEVLDRDTAAIGQMMTGGQAASGAAPATGVPATKEN